MRFRLMIVAAAAAFSTATLPALAKHSHLTQQSRFKSVSQWVCVNPHGKTAKYLMIGTTDKGTFKSVWSEKALRAELFKWSDDITPETWDEFKAIVASGQTALLPERGSDIYTRVCATDPRVPLTSPETGAASHN